MATLIIKLLLFLFFAIYLAFANLSISYGGDFSVFSWDNRLQFVFWFLVLLLVLIPAIYWVFKGIGKREVLVNFVIGRMDFEVYSKEQLSSYDLLQAHLSKVTVLSLGFAFSIAFGVWLQNIQTTLLISFVPMISSAMIIFFFVLMGAEHIRLMKGCAHRNNVIKFLVYSIGLVGANFAITFTIVLADFIKLSNSPFFLLN